VLPSCERTVESLPVDDVKAKVRIIRCFERHLGKLAQAIAIPVPTGSGKTDASDVGRASQSITLNVRGTSPSHPRAGAGPV